MPPPVLPAQAPINISITRMVRESPGHWLKSVVAKPVVVMMDPTWNRAWRRISHTLSKRLRMSKAMIRVEARMIPR